MNASARRPNDVFLSYSSQDLQTATSLAEALERQNWVVWWDRQIVAGQYYDVAIENALDESSIVILLWSKAASASNWVRSEVEEAASRGILLPARLDSTKLPLQLRRIQTIDLSAWQPTTTHVGLQSLLLATAAMLGKPVVDLGPLPSAQAYFDEGMLSERQGDLFKAAKAYVRALKADGEFTPAQTRLLALVTSNRQALLKPSEPNIEVGTVSWFNDQKGYGFIVPETQGLPVFIHIRAVERSGLTTLIEGARVAYLAMSSAGKLSIFKVRVI